MSQDFGGLLLGFGLAGTFYAVLNWASFKTLTAEIMRMRQAVYEANTTVLRLESASKRLKDDADYWKYTHEEEDEEDE